jgi:hypothetical protein
MLTVIFSVDHIFPERYRPDKKLSARKNFLFLRGVATEEGSLHIELSGEGDILTEERKRVEGAAS